MSNDTLTVSLTLTASPSAPRVPVVIEKSATSSELRLKAAEATKIPLSSLKLIFRGRLINDDSKQVVSEYKLEDDCVIHCMGKPVVTEESSSAAAAAAAPAVGSTGSTPTFLPPAAAVPAPAATAGSDPLQTALNTLRSSNTPSVYLTAVTTLEKILSNCVEKPLEEKYRSVKKQNAAFQRRLGGLQGGDAAMLASGFVSEGQGDEQFYVLRASPEAWPKLLATKAKVSAAVVEAKSAAGTASAPPLGAAGGFGGASLPPPAGMPGGMGAGLPPGLGAGGVPPNMQNAMANLMSDPNQLQNMLQNPMVRNMLMNDPRFANNPQMRQSLDMLSSNPQMLNQVSGMMRDPAMQAQMQSMMNSQGMNMPGGMMPGGMNNANAPNASGTQPQNNSNNNNEQADQEMTEEEMIQEAIQRSLRES